MGMKTYKNYDKIINDVNASLDKKANQSSFDTYKKYIGTAKRFKNDFTYFQAVAKNPLTAAAYTNSPVGIYISFEKGECKNVNCIEVYLQAMQLSGNGDTYPVLTKVPFQWEGDAHQKTGISFETYNDGSLKHGTIWVSDTFTTALESHTYLIKIYEADQSNTYTPIVAHSIISATEGTKKEGMTANGIQLIFEQASAYHLRRMLVDTIDTGTLIQLLEISIKNNTYADIKTTTASNINVLNYSFIGSGIMYMDCIVNFNFVYNTNIIGTTKVRLWFNGNFDIDCRISTAATISSGVFNGVNFKSRWNSINSTTMNIYNGAAICDGDTAPIILGMIKDIQINPDYPDTNTYPLTKYCDIDSGVNRFMCLWQNTNPTTFAIPAGSMWSTRFMYSPKGFVKTDYTKEANKRMNPLKTRATKENVNNLKYVLAEQCKRFLIDMKAFNDTVINISTGKPMFPGCNIIQDLAYMDLTGIDTWAQINVNYDYMINTLYGGGTQTGFWNKFLSESWDSGIEYMGRNTACLPYLRNKYIDLNNQAKVTEVTNIIHGLADCYLQIETYSGGGGKMCLTHASQSLENTNAESSALKAIKASLDIVEDTNRRNCYNRIKIRLETVRIYDTIIPHGVGNSAVTTTEWHYEVFPTMDYAICVPYSQWIFAITQRALEGTAPSGALREIGFNYAQNRRGFGHSAAYAIGTLAKGNISEVQQAVNIFGYLLEKMYPVGYHEYPIDGWGNNDSYLANSTIETQAVAEILYNL